MKWIIGTCLLLFGLGLVAVGDVAAVVSPPAVPAGPVALSAGQESFAESLASLPLCVGTVCGQMSLSVTRGWAKAEGGGVNPGQPANNYLFLSCGGAAGCVSLAGGLWRTFASPADAALAVWAQLIGSPAYAGVVAAAASGLGDDPVIEAIAGSPWDGGHYASAAGQVGAKLIWAYDAVLGVGARACLHGAACLAH